MGTFTQLTFQAVFGSKYHQKFLTETNQVQLFEYFGGVLKNMGCIPFIVGGHVDHMHLVFSTTGKYSIGRIMQDVKTSTNAFMHKNKVQFSDFVNWQTGYGAFSYSRSHLDNLIQYVLNQKTHHEKVSFEEEYVALLEEHGIEYNPLYLFD
jgi:REP element-mobilizing transposase RayT